MSLIRVVLHITVLCSTTTSGSAITLTSELTVTLIYVVGLGVTCRNGGSGNSNTTGLTVAGKLLHLS